MPTNFKFNINLPLILACSVLLFGYFEDTSLASFKEVDWVDYLSRQLMSQGVKDLTNENLIEVLHKTNNEAIKDNIILLFGRKGIKETVPVIVPFLKDSNTNTRIAAADALRMLGSFEGIPVLEKICEEQPDDLKCLDAAGILAEGGSFSAYKYLKGLSKSKTGSYRSGALNHMKTLSEKLDSDNPNQSRAVQDDMLSILYSDEDARVKEHAIWLLSGIKTKNNKYIIERMKEMRDKFVAKGENKQIRQQMDHAIGHLEFREKKESK